MSKKNGGGVCNELWVVTKNGNFRQLAGNKNTACHIMRQLAGLPSDAASVDYKDGTGIEGLRHYRARLSKVEGKIAEPEPTVVADEATEVEVTGAATD